jgi:hypothetical protein
MSIYSEEWGKDASKDAISVLQVTFVNMVGYGKLDGIK